MQEPGAVIGVDQRVQELVDPVALDAGGDVEGVGAGQLAGALQLLRHPLAVPLADRLGGLAALIVEHERGDAGHRRQVIGTVHPLDVVRECAAHDQPHDDLGALEPAERGVLRVGHPDERGGVVGDPVEELPVPLRVVEPGPLAVHLVREPAGGHDGHLDVLGVALDRAAQRLAQLVAPRGGRDGELEHADLERHDRGRPPAVLAFEQHRHRGEETVVQRLVLEVGQVELVGDQALGDVRGERGVSRHRGQAAGAAALVRDGVLLADAQRERRVVVEEERRDVIVEDVDDRVGPVLLEPGGHRLERPEDRGPVGVVLLVLVVGKANSRRVRGGDATDDPGHLLLLRSFSRSAGAGMKRALQVALHMTL